MEQQTRFWFHKTYTRLGEARRTLERLKAISADAINPTKYSDMDGYLMHFGHCIRLMRGVYYTLKKEGEQIPSFKKWFDNKGAEMNHDALYAWVKNTRDAVEKEGVYPITFYHEGSVIMRDGMRFSDGASASVGGAFGNYWIVNKNTVDQYEEPIRPQDREVGGWNSVVKAKIISPPLTHKGQARDFSDPVILCAIAFGYLKEIWWEACLGGYAGADI